MPALAKANLKELIAQGVVWAAQQETTSKSTHPYALPCCSASPLASQSLDPIAAKILAENLLHEWFYEYADPLVSRPPLCAVYFLLHQIVAAQVGNSAWQSGASKEKKFIFLIGPEIWPSPHYLRDCIAGAKTNALSLKNFIFINPPSEKARLWALETALASTQVAAVVAQCPKLPFASTQKLLLLAKKGGTRGFIFRERCDLKLKTAAQARWSISPQLCSSVGEPSSSVPRWRMTLLMAKGTYPDINQWSVELNDGTEISLNLLPELVYRPGAPQTENAAANQGYGGSRRRA